VSPPDELESMYIAAADSTALRSRTNIGPIQSGLGSLYPNSALWGTAMAISNVERDAAMGVVANGLRSAMVGRKDRNEGRAARSRTRMAHICINWILENFQKLLVGHARHRITIFQQQSEYKANEVYRKLTEQVRAFDLTQPNDRYLFLGLNCDKAEFSSELPVT
jgi:hypothetical protein